MTARELIGEGIEIGHCALYAYSEHRDDGAVIVSWTNLNTGEQREQTIDAGLRLVGRRWTVEARMQRIHPNDQTPIVLLAA